MEQGNSYQETATTQETAKSPITPEALPPSITDTPPEADAAAAEPKANGAAPDQLLQVPTHSVEADPDQPRRLFDPEKLQALAEDVERHGIILPLLVRRQVNPSGGERYQLIAGERRLRAARQAGLAQVPVLVKDVSDEEASLTQLRENLLRADLNPIEEAHGLQRYKWVSGKTWKAVAAELGWAKQTVLAKSRLLEAPPTVRGMIETGEFAPSSYQEISSLSEEEQVELVSRAVEEKLTIQDLRRERDRIKGVKKAGKDSQHEGTSAEGDPSEEAQGTEDSAPGEGHGTVTPEAEVVDPVTEVSSDTRGDGESESDRGQNTDPHDGTEGHGTETPDAESGTEKGEEATKELRVILDAAVYARLEQRGGREGMSIQGFARKLLTRVADVSHAKAA